MTRKVDLTKAIKFVTVGAMLAGGLVTTTAAHANSWVSANAPITYKGANPNAPQYQMPQYQAPQLQAPQYQPQAALRHQPVQPQMQYAPQMTTPGAIDTNLYAHQKVGKPYTVAGQTYYPQHDPSYNRTGIASWYGDKFHGKLTANGERFDKNAMTAAHPTLPLNSYVNVTNLQTGQTITVRLNDRGPFIDNRLIDLSEAAATALGIRNGGLAQVQVQYAGPAHPGANPRVKPAPQRQAMAPVMPMPQAPVYQAPAPQQVLPQAPTYQPLRQQAQPPAQSVKLSPATPTAPTPPQYTAPFTTDASPADMGVGVALPAIPPSIPQGADMADNRDGGVVTLTIKGPVHMANTGTDQAQPVFIQAVNRRVYRTEK